MTRIEGNNKTSVVYCLLQSLDSRIAIDVTEDSLKKKTDRQKSIIPLLLRHKIPIEKLDIERLPKKKGFVRFPRNRMVPSTNVIEQCALCDLYLNASCIRSRLELHYLRDSFIREVIDSKIEAYQTPEKTKKHVFFLTPLRF